MTLDHNLTDIEEVEDENASRRDVGGDSMKNRKSSSKVTAANGARDVCKIASF